MINHKSTVTKVIPTDVSVLKIARTAPASHENTLDTALAPWDEIVRAFRNHRMLMGPLVGIESYDNADYGIVSFKGVRVVIPMKHMLYLEPRKDESETNYSARLRKRLNYMLGAEIDFYVKGVDEEDHSAVASRTEAMLKKRLRAYYILTENGTPRITVNSYVQARVIAVFDRAIRIEVFGVEHTIFGRNLAWEWIGDAHDAFSVGQILIARIDSIDFGHAEKNIHISEEYLKSLRIIANIKAAVPNMPAVALSKCLPQSHYAGRVVEINNGTIYVQLANGANAIAYSCRDRRAPGLHDDVNFVVTRISTKECCAIGLITRVIRKNL